MDDRKTWLEADYYENFRCKGGACRNSCCEGWQIGVGMQEYFKLIGMDCSEDLHRRLECAFRVPESPSPERFRVIAPDWMGRCPLHGSDGLCMLQKECGADVLPEICRVYPRSMKAEAGMNQACCSGSCEAVVELLQRQDKLEFHFAELAAKPEFNEESQPNLLEIGPECMKKIQQREINLVQRVQSVCSALRAEESPAMDPPAALELAMEGLKGVMEDSPSLQFYGAAALERYACADGWSIYAEDRRQFEAHFPAWQRWYENLLANHFLYMDFPCVDARLSQAAACDGLCLLYALLRLIPAAWCAQHPNAEAAVDSIAGIFRLAEHSPFYYNAHVMAKNNAALLLL